MASGAGRNDLRHHLYVTNSNSLQNSGERTRAGYAVMAQRLAGQPDDGQFLWLADTQRDLDGSLLPGKQLLAEDVVREHVGHNFVTFGSQVPAANVGSLQELAESTIRKVRGKIL